MEEKLCQLFPIVLDIKTRMQLLPCTVPGCSYIQRLPIPSSIGVAHFVYQHVTMQYTLSNGETELQHLVSFDTKEQWEDDWRAKHVTAPYATRVGTAHVHTLRFKLHLWLGRGGVTVQVWFPDLTASELTEWEKSVEEVNGISGGRG